MLHQVHQLEHRVLLIYWQIIKMLVWPVALIAAPWMLLVRVLVTCKAMTTAERARAYQRRSYKRAVRSRLMEMWAWDTLRKKTMMWVLSLQPVLGLR